MTCLVPGLDGRKPGPHTGGMPSPSFPLRAEDRVPMADTPPQEDRTYLRFLVAGLAIALGGGFVLAVVAPLAASGVLPLEERTYLLIQAHAVGQLLGFAGLVVAGMALRLIPRFAGATPPSSRLAGAALGLLAGSAVLRMVAQPWVDGPAGDIAMVAAGIAGSAGMVLVAAMLWSTLRRGKKTKPEPWRDFVRAGIAWWLAWACLSLFATARAVQHDRLVPARLEDSISWVAMLGVIGSFIWAVQGRSVSVFYGRKARSRAQALPPFALLNGGLALVLVSGLMNEGILSWRVEGAGLLSAGAALVWLGPVLGSAWGRATRLRARARPAARYIIVANLSAIGAGLLLVVAGASTLASGEYSAFWARDAGRHLFALGTITMLIVGMAQLVAPVFAMERAQSRRMRLRDESVFWLLLAALLTRAGAGILAEVTDYATRMNHSAYAGMLAWVALALFAWRLVEAIRREPEMKALLAGPAPGR